MSRTRTTGRWVTAALAAAACALCVGAGNVSAGDTIFRRSYYSHAIPPELEPYYPRPESRSAYRPAWVGTTPGFAIRGVHRFNSVYLRSGLSTDLTIIREDWFEVTPPFAE